MSERAANEQLRWSVAASARPGETGSAIVSVVAGNAMVPEMAFDMLVDWHPGAEAPDVEGRALITGNLSGQGDFFQKPHGQSTAILPGLIVGGAPTHTPPWPTAMPVAKVSLS